MANNENLKPLNERSEEERKEIAKKGGVASGKARNEKKRLKLILEEILEREEYDHFIEGNVSGYEKIALALYRSAKGGNIRAFTIIRDTIGENQKEE